MLCHICDKNGVLACSVCGKTVCLEHGRFGIVCSSCMLKKEKISFSIREALSKDRRVIGELIRMFWGEDVQVAFDKEFAVKDLPAYVATVGNNVVGFISYYDLEDMLIVALGILPKYQGLGIGKALVHAVENRARELSKRRILVSTTNDNLLALAFYQMLGFQIYEVVPGAIAKKHGKTVLGFNNIPIRDEIRLCKILK